MNFSFSEEQNLLKDSISKFMLDNYDFETRQKSITQNHGFNEQHWQLMAELGWLAIPFKEEDGGLDGGAAEIILLMEEFGKGLVVEPYLATVLLAGGAISELGNANQKQQYLDPIIAGSKQAALAVVEKSSRFKLDSIATTATANGNDYLLDGEKTVVLNGDRADFLIVSAKETSNNQLSLFIVETNTPGLNSLAYKTADDFSAAEITFDKVKAEKLGTGNNVLSTLEFLTDRACLALCAEAVGAMEVLYKETVAYSKERKQFGTNIGSFQVLQHRMVDMYIEYEKTKSLLYLAAIRMDEGENKAFSKAIAALKAQTGQAGKFCGQQAVQLHGGMGMTDELKIGHYFKRLTMIEVMFGNADYHLQRFSQL